MSTIKVTNLQNASAASPAIVLDANSRATLNGLSYPTEGSLSGRNRIINGDMRIDQRNAGASVTPTNGQYTVDRWAGYLGQASKYSVQQSSTVPTGFNNSLLVTSLSAYSVAAAEWFGVAQRIEGFNIADLGWGTADAKTVTLSFWIRSSLTGTFGGSLNNSAFSYNYPFSYAINSANTWEQKTITISGPTSGTWLATNGSGVQVHFSIGTGSTYSATAGSWTSTANILTATGATSVVGTNGATFYITGVQLEAGSVATPFERRSYGQELALCQRYFQRYTDATTGGDGGFLTCANYTAINAYGGHTFMTTMRAGPSFSHTGTMYLSNGSADTSITIDQMGSSVNCCELRVGDITMTAGYAGWIRIEGGSAHISFDAEL